MKKKRAESQPAIVPDSKAEAKAAAEKAAAAAAAANAAKRFDATKAQVDEVVDIMRLNVDKVLERDQKLSSLDERAGTTFFSSIIIN